MARTRRRSSSSRVRWPTRVSPVGARLRRLVNADATEAGDGYRVTADGEHVADIHFRALGLPTTTTIGDDVEDHGYLSSALLTVAERVAATV